MAAFLESLRDLGYVEGRNLLIEERRTDQYRRAATYVDKVLNGAKPADLPVE